MGLKCHCKNPWLSGSYVKGHWKYLKQFVMIGRFDYYRCITYSSKEKGFFLFNTLYTF
jgi:hypothetical protein